MIKFNYPAGATVLDPDAMEGLIPRHISTQSELNEWEQQNIIIGEKWAFSVKKRDILTIDFVKLVHKKMFGKTWRWAGEFRRSYTNIGVDYSTIQIELYNLLEDVKCQIEKNSYPQDEIAYRFHHRLVSIHPFPNGNGRHARTMTDIVLVQLDQPRFSWGSRVSATKDQVRSQYIHALKEADKHNYKELSKFVRS